MSGVTGGLAAAAAATSIAAGVQGMTSSGGEGAQAAAGAYIPPSVTAKEANALNAKVLRAINKTIRKNNRYQRDLERMRHGELREDINWFRGQMEGAVELADPYVKERRLYIDKMRALMDDPTSFLEKSPEYRARMAGGLEALTSQMASRGLIGSGNVAIEAQALGAREASTQLGKDWERLAKLSGLMDADLGTAANIAGGALVPRGQEYDPRFEGERNPMFAFDQGRQLEPGQLIPDTSRQDRQQDFTNVAGGLALLGGAYDDYERRSAGRRGTFVNDQGYIVSY